jgi:outer membrane protein TolC
MAPLVNRKALKSALGVASARQQQAVLNYEQTLLEAYLEVENSLARMSNMGEAYTAKSEEVNVLGASVSVSVNLFNSARADYAEVLLTQREALEARMEAVELRRSQHLARVALYRALGGGWKP